jgi:hypothetical protein
MTKQEDTERENHHDLEEVEGNVMIDETDKFSELDGQKKEIETKENTDEADKVEKLDGQKKEIAGDEIVDEVDNVDKTKCISQDVQKDKQGVVQALETQNELDHPPFLSTNMSCMVSAK